MVWANAGSSLHESLVLLVLQLQLTWECCSRGRTQDTGVVTLLAGC
jgi:hypothetical protein